MKKALKVVGKVLLKMKPTMWTNDEIYFIYQGKKDIWYKRFLVYKRFFNTLELCGCETCSIEARTDDFKSDIFDAVNILKSLI